MNAAVVTGLCTLLLLLLVLNWKWSYFMESLRGSECLSKLLKSAQGSQSSVALVPHDLSHEACGYQLDQKDSLDEHLDVLARRLAEKEGRLRISHLKLRETQHVMESLQAVDQGVRAQYRQLMDALRQELASNERDCRTVQEQIESVSRQHAEIKLDVNHGQRLYSEAAAELASSLAELQRGRTDHRVVEKPFTNSQMSLKFRKEPQLPRSSVGSIQLKSPQHAPSCRHHNQYRAYEPEREYAF